MSADSNINQWRYSGSLREPYTVALGATRNYNKKKRLKKINNIKQDARTFPVEFPQQIGLSKRSSCGALDDWRLLTRSTLGPRFNLHERNVRVLCKEARCMLYLA